MADSTLKSNPLSSKKNREAGDAKRKHFLKDEVKFLMTIGEVVAE